MTRMDDLLEAATSRFRYDAGLREEIVRELRAHLEDSIAAARAEGVDEAQAEEAAVRAFGDPEEIGEKLWQANRRRLRRRAAAMAAVGVVLMPAGIVAAAWFITWLLAESIGPWHAIISIAAIAIIYFLTRRFLPKTARFGISYLRWLSTAFTKSVRIAFSNAWIWAPALAFFAVNVAEELISKWPDLIRSRSYTHIGLGIVFPSLWESAHKQLAEVGPHMPWGAASLLLYLGYLLFAKRMGTWLQSAPDVARRRARGWHIAFVVSASAGVLSVTWGLLWDWFTWNGRYNAFNSGRLLISILQPLVYVELPFVALISALFLTIVLRRLRGQALSPGGILSSALIVIGPILWLSIILLLGVIGLSGLWPFLHPAHKPFDMPLLQSFFPQALDFLRVAPAFLPVIIVSEQCGLRRACVRFGDFVWRHLWRYVAFVFLGALLLGLPQWAPGPAFDSNAATWPVLVLVTRVAIRVALQLVLTVMCFEFYLTRAGTVIPMAAEETSSQVAPDGTR
jgi:hypothetical protein